MSTFDQVAELPLEVERYELEGLEYEAPGFTRLTTLIKLQGGGEHGVGEDVVYASLDHIALRDAGPIHDLTGPSTIGEFCELVGDLDLFPSPPEREDMRGFRRWAFESAALDLALRQSGTNLAEAVGREPRPVTFVMSMRLTPLESDEKPTIEPVKRRLEMYPNLRFKLDPTNDWDEELIAELVETGAVDSLDLKGQYKGTPVDVETDPELYRLLAESFPNAWLEDPDLNEETDKVLEPHRDRITWDAPIHSIADIESLPFPPRMVNLKPSRLGGVKSLFDAYDYCEEHRIGAYGGGQWELGPGRGHIQYLASLFHPDTPNDTAPAAYNRFPPEPGLPDSPLEPRIPATGFRWAG